MNFTCRITLTVRTRRVVKVPILNFGLKQVVGEWEKHVWDVHARGVVLLIAYTTRRAGVGANVATAETLACGNAGRAVFAWPSSASLHELFVGGKDVPEHVHSPRSKVSALHCGGCPRLGYA